MNKWVIFVPLLAAVTFSACEKEVRDTPSPAELAQTSHAVSQAVERPFKMNSETWYRISPLSTTTDLTDPPGMKGYANAAGRGTGNATQMGNGKNWFNQLVYSPTGADPAAGTAIAPVIDALSYPVLGFPLPLVQANDFDELRAANIWLKIPRYENGQIINSVIYTDRGDAIFTSLTTHSTTVFISPTRINFSAEGQFVGGRGKFANATGTYTQTGYFNPQDANDAGYAIDGIISY